MTPYTIAILAFPILVCSLLYLWDAAAGKHRRLPPGPLPLPVIGNLHMLGHLPHQALCHLSKKFGPIMSIRLGNVLAIVVSSPCMARLFLKTHDQVFAGRPEMQSVHYFSYGRRGIGFTEYGPYWRNIRKLCTIELLSALKIESFAPMRREEVGFVVQSLKAAAEAEEVVDVTAKVFALIEDITYRMVFGQQKRLDEKLKLKDIIQQTFSMMGAFNLADFVPYFAPFDFQGINRNSKKLRDKFDLILEKIIDEHIQDASTNQETQRDFISVMLSLMNETVDSTQNEAKYMIDRTNIKAIMFEILAAGMDTSATAIEWTLSELIKNQRVMKKLQEELQSAVGSDKMVQESDLVKCDYLDMVVKESLRLHPVGPLLLPHESIEDITINGYFIPKKSRVLINAWSIGRDHNVWSNNANEFYPERFVSCDIDLRGRNFELIPFGSGRRGCPGIQLALTTVKLVVAQFVHCFNWELSNGALASDLDMDEKFSLSVGRANRLQAMPIYRLHVKST
ncbi:Cytochrome P450 [Dillenia turbinata]|uniref:Cytochrome P450 n=1 Tax=Dillenia turbinata TaxID=194707 RepID=A0AAN8Z1J6_9MAGN